MALILYFNSNKKTKELLHTIVDIPKKIVGLKLNHLFENNLKMED